MKTIGIVGGVAWPSTVVYYQLINSMIAEIRWPRLMPPSAGCATKPPVTHS
jgi:hypothetical protein